MISNIALAEATNNTLEKLWLLKSMKVPTKSLLPMYSDTCPFCIESKRERGCLVCGSCEYAKTHGDCGNQDSVWNRMISAVNKSYKYDHAADWKEPFGERERLAIEMAICKAEVALTKQPVTLDSLMLTKRDFLKQYLTHMPGCLDVVVALDEYW